MLFPKVAGQSRHAVVEDVRVLQRLVAVVILGMHAEHGRLDAQVDVFGDEDHARVVLLLLQRERLPENDVVVGLTRQALRQRALQLARLEEQAPR